VYYVPTRQTSGATRMSAPVRRDQLLDVTSEIVAQQGFQGVSIQAVARSAGISRPVVYEHFGDLHGVLEALIERETARALAQVSETTPADLTDCDAAEVMLDSLRRYLDAVEEHPSRWRLVLMPPEGAPELLRMSVVSGRAAILRKLTHAVSPLLGPAGADPNPELTARILSALADEYARLLLTDPESFPRERLMAHARWYLEHFMASAFGLAR
jgi:AcrR family transcriptional regulator